MPESMDIVVYLLAFLAVIINGMAKGGLGSIVGSLSVPLMSLAMDPVQAAAVLLPLLLLMDFISMWKFRGQIYWPAFIHCLPAGIVGVAIGAMIFNQLSDASIRLLIGLVSLGFCLLLWLQRNSTSRSKSSAVKGSFWGCLTGFTSFGIHAGGPPLSIYLLPLGLSSHLLMGTQAWIFAGLNFSKVAAYSWLGQLDFSNLVFSLFLVPAAPAGVFLGYYLLNRLSQKIIYGFCYLSLFSLGSVLFFQGVRELF
ncbi:sulfite exporter TauE/SafE family protein [Sansalvadorimonas sp. 2012CJ34-2]|uniref:Probable membrane transporter protein n=1 Tax=Parendozoicomonas callyspongiae TaxID=2942213 RepID=A0ABT0PBC0_9GAMM|nr:sulfite exporter TauE/SafE family protein [Sansalvadorimonas sp. 2012CJ34-2]MCL6268583.1 sulfite exporter TauE/SafE family protein [Sansalvadorimonas sp. 2012CJ34-2]